MTDPVHGKTGLEVVLEEALRALTVLDAEAIEGLAVFLEGNSGRVELPRSAAEWERLRWRQWILGHLLDGTGRRLEILRRLSSLPERRGSYGGRSLRGVLLDRSRRLAPPEPASKPESFAGQPGAGERAN